MRSPRLLLLLGAVFLVAGCAHLQKLASQAFQNPKVAFSRAALQDVSLSGATVDLFWMVENPNPIGIQVAELDYLFQVEGKQVVAGKPPQGLNIAAKRRGELNFPAAVKFADLVPVLTTFLTKDSAAYQASGNLGFQTPIGVLRFPISHQGVFPVPKLPDVQFESPRITKMDLLGATLEIPLVVTNKNGFALPIDALAGGLQIAGARVGQLNAGSLSLDAQGSRRVTLPLRVDFAQALSAANAIRQGKASVGFDGQLKSGAVTMPVGFSQNLTFTR